MAVSYASAKPYFYGTGRRKSSVARVRLFPGTGNITINGQDIDKYFGLETLKLIINQPFDVTDTRGKFDIVANVNGGRDPSRRVPRSAPCGRQLPCASQEGRVPHPRPSYEGAQEVRSQGGSPRKPVLQEISLRNTATRKKIPVRPDGYFLSYDALRAVMIAT